METERITFQPSRLCRACGAESLHMFPLSARGPEGDLRLDYMLMACTDLKIHVGDGLPSSICYSCADELKTSYRFKQRCETTDRYFNELGLKSNEVKQEQETVVFEEGENENLFESKEERNTNDNSSNLSFKGFTENISEAVIISRKTKQEQGDLLTITETNIYKQEDFAISVGNVEDSRFNEDSCLEDFPNKKENQNVVSKKAGNEELPLGSKEEKEEETIQDGSSEASSSSKDDDSDYFPKKELWKSSRLGHFERNILGRLKLTSSTSSSSNLRKRFKCDVCGKSYSTTAYLRLHKKTHENNEQKHYKCNVCEKSYSMRCSLQKHTEIHENGAQKRFECDICEKSFTLIRYLRLHKQRHENGERKSFKCDICEKSFATRMYLWKHKRRHEDGGRKRFECDVCEKSFAENRNLREHKQMHQNGGRKCFKCDVCEKSFAMNANLRKHKRTHENGGRKCFECDVCEKTFSMSRYLRVHKRRHENGKQKYYKCNVCEKSFAESRNLQEHKKTHKNSILYERK